MSYKKKLEELASRGMNFGTERTRAILNALGSPDDKLKIVHVAGTNGKGSVAEYITQILIAAGKSVGTFTSPAVYDYLECFRIDGENISEERFLESFDAVFSLKESAEATRFEIETATAIYAFYLAGCEYAVLECGMGGLLDATNAVNRKEIAVITSVSLEHTRFLGGTIEEICAQKAGIIKDCAAVASGLQTNETKAYMRGKGVILADKPVEIIKSGLSGQTFAYDGSGFFTQMLGFAQPFNAATAIEAARLLKIDENAIYTGVKAAKLAARLEVLQSSGKTYLLDGAHNPAAFVPLVGLLKEYCEKEGITPRIIYGCLSDKDAEGCVKRLAEIAQSVIAVQPSSPRAMDLQKIKEICERYFKEVKTAESVSAALNTAKGELVVVCGSFTLLKEAKDFILNK